MYPAIAPIIPHRGCQLILVVRQTHENDRGEHDVEEPGAGNEMARTPAPEAPKQQQMSRTAVATRRTSAQNLLFFCAIRYS